MFPKVCSRGNTTSRQFWAYNNVMTAKPKKAKGKKLRRRSQKIGDLHASVEDDLLLLADRETSAEGRWNRPRKRRLSLRVDVEVVDWFKSKGPGYQTRINRILRRVMMEGKKRIGEK
jgi:uncharacterized protein (DUF4415 family)